MPKPPMLYLDTETYVERAYSVKKVGPYRHAEHCEVTIFTYAIGERQPAQAWDISRGESMPSDLADALRDESLPIAAFNAMFDRVVIRRALDINPALERWRCAMVKAYTCGISGSLEAVGEILGLDADQAKLKDGKKLIQKFALPTTGGKRRGHDTHPDDWARFVAYARRDVEALREIWKRLPGWVYRNGELALWHMDQRINDRGLPIDQDLLHRAIEAVDSESESLHQRCRELTEGFVRSLNCLQPLSAWLAAGGVSLQSLDKAAIAAALRRNDLPEEVRAVLELRQQAAKSSTKKYDAVLDRISADGRLRGTLQHGGAKRTLRTAGRGFQPQNLPSRGLGDERTAVNAILSGSADLLYDSPMHAASAAIRGLVCAEPGWVIEAADLSNIEGRVLAWLAQEQWKVDAFRDFDAGNGPDLYVVAYARSFGAEPEDVTSPQRAVGKVQELALGFGGGVNALVSMATGYGMDPASMVAPVMASAPGHVAARAAEEYTWAKKNGRTAGLPEEQYIALAVIRSSWRDAHPKVVAFWRKMEQGVLAAIRSPGDAYKAGPRISASVRKHEGHSWLLLRLPSGRYLMYFEPRVVEYEGRAVITFWDEDPYTRTWSEQTTYGGKLVENCTQAVARDVLFFGLTQAEGHGVEVVTHVHDEIVAERPFDQSTPTLAACMSVLPPWAEGLPLAAKGFTDERYHK